MNLTTEELNLIRQWFNAVQDLNPNALTDKDMSLGVKISTYIHEQAPELIDIKLVDAEMPDGAVFSLFIPDSED